MFSDALLTLAFWTGIAAFLLSWIVLGTIFLIRFVTSRADRRRMKFIKTWQQILRTCCHDEYVSVPSIPLARAYLFLRLWNQAYENLPIDHNELSTAQKRHIRNQLQVIARRVGAPGMAQALLDKGTFREQIEGMKSLGYLQNYKAWPQLKKIAEASQGYSSYVALQALFYMNQPEELPLISPGPSSMVVMNADRRSGNGGP